MVIDPIYTFILQSQIIGRIEILTHYPRKVYPTRFRRPKLGILAAIGQSTIAPAPRTTNSKNRSVRQGNIPLIAPRHVHVRGAGPLPRNWIVYTGALTRGTTGRKYTAIGQVVDPGTEHVMV